MEGAQVDAARPGSDEGQVADELQVAIAIAGPRTTALWGHLGGEAKILRGAFGHEVDLDEKLEKLMAAVVPMAENQEVERAQVLTEEGPALQLQAQHEGTQSVLEPCTPTHFVQQREEARVRSRSPRSQAQEGGEDQTVQSDSQVLAATWSFEPEKGITWNIEVCIPGRSKLVLEDVPGDLNGEELRATVKRRLWVQDRTFQAYEERSMCLTIREGGRSKDMRWLAHHTLQEVATRRTLKLSLEFNLDGGGKKEDFTKLLISRGVPEGEVENRTKEALSALGGGSKVYACMDKESAQLQWAELKKLAASKDWRFVKSDEAKKFFADKKDAKKQVPAAKAAADGHVPDP